MEMAAPPIAVALHVQPGLYPPLALNFTGDARAMRDHELSGDVRPRFG